MSKNFDVVERCLILIIILTVLQIGMSIYRLANPEIKYKRNVIEVYYEADENGIRRGDNVITIDLSGTNPKIKEN